MTTFTSFIMSKATGERRLVPVSSVATFTKKCHAVENALAVQNDKTIYDEARRQFFLMEYMKTIQATSRTIKNRAWFTHRDDETTRAWLVSCGNTIKS